MYGRYAMDRLVQGVVFLMWVVAYGWLWGSGRYNQFLQPKLVFLVIGGLVLFLMLMIPIMFPRRGAGGCCRQSSDYIWLHGAMLLLPILFMGEALRFNASSDAFLRKSAISPAVAGGTWRKKSSEWITQHNSNPNEAVHANLLNLVRLVDQFEGQQVVTEGVVYRDEHAADDQLFIYRFVMVCCAADARPVGVLVQTPDAHRFSNDTWVRVRGKIHLTAAEDQMIPSIVAESVEAYESTESPFLYY